MASADTPSLGQDPLPARAAAWTEIKPSTGLWRLDVRELWAYREVALSLAIRTVRARYKQTALGVGWVVIQPLAAVLVFSFIFGRVVDLPSDGLPYPIFAYAGLIAWTYFAGSLDAATKSLVEGRELITKVYFPRLLAPLASVLPRLIDFAVGLVAVAVAMVIFGVAPTLAILTLPLWIAATVLTALAGGLLLSALNVRYRDIGQAITLLIQLMLYASPVVFPASLVDGTARWILSLNPMTGVLDGFRWALVGAPPPPVQDLLSLASGLVLLLAGLVYFQRTERGFADVI